MEKRAGTIKYLLRLFVFMLAGLAAVTLSFFISRHSSLGEQAESLLMAREYAQAAELYAKAGNGAMQEHCLRLLDEQSYNQARIGLQTGNYAYARAAFLELGDYKDSQNLIAACDYLSAGELMQRGEYGWAKEILDGLDESYPGRAAALEKCSEGLYKNALTLAREGSYGEALEMFSALGVYADSPVLARRLERMLAWLDLPAGERISAPEKKYSNSYFEQVYMTEDAYVVLPEECSSGCRFLLYYPGGKDDEINIDFLIYYLMNPAPDTIAVFLRTNGLYSMREKALAAVDVIERAAAERGVFPTEIVSCGSSLGAYPAMHSALDIPALSGLSVGCVLSLDAGDDWNSPYVLSRSQCMALKESGTQLYLFESPWVGTDRPAIKTMVDSGVDLTLVGCVYDEHVRITLDAMGMGVLHWAVGDRTQPCGLDIYSFTKLS